MSKYRIKRVTKENISELPHLMKHCFNMEVSIEYFTWKYFNNPFGSIIAFYAIHNKTEEIAGFYGVTPMKYLINSTEKTLFRTVDSMTHSKHRRKGIWKMLINHCHKELRKQDNLITFSTSSGGKMNKGRQKEGWKSIFKMVNYFLPKIMSSFNRNVDDANIKIVKDYNLITHLLNLRNCDIEIVKTPDIYKWRTSNPRFNYITIGYNNRRRISSYLTYYIDQNKIILFDFYFNEKEESKQLISFLLREVKKHDLKGVVSLVQENSEYAKQLSRAGFLYNPFSFGPLSHKWFFLFFTNKNMKQYIDPKRWNISSFDHDAT